MDSANIEELKKILNQLCEERDLILQKIDENSVLIREADRQRESILNKDDEDFKVFSPRTMEDLHREELEELEQKKTECQQNNNSLFHERNKLNAIIDVLDKTIKEDSDPDRNLAMLNIQEEERRRISRDLHDTVLQNLSHLIHKIELGTLFIDQDPVRAKLELALVNKMLKEVIDEIRNIIFDLRPMTFDDLGLKAAFERLISQINSDKQFDVESDIEDVSCENNLVLTTIYRIVREALINISKHAEADKIVFSCRQAGNMCIVKIEDNGKGFNREEVEHKEGRHFGLSWMRESVHFLRGKFEITSEISSGTKIQIEIPLN